MIDTSSEAALPLVDSESMPADADSAVACMASNIATSQGSQNSACTVDAATTLELPGDANTAPNVIDSGSALSSDIRFAAADERSSTSGPADAGPVKRSLPVNAQSHSAKYLAPLAVDLAISADTGHHGRHSTHVAAQNSDASVSDFFELLGAA